jgi:hypothetical protein
VVVGFDGVAVNGAMHNLLGYIRRNLLRGETVTVDVVRDGTRVGLRRVLK